MGAELPKIPPWWNEDTAPVKGPAPDGLLSGLQNPDFGGGLALIVAPRDAVVVNEMPATMRETYNGPISLLIGRANVGKESTRRVGQEYSRYDQHRPELERIAKNPGIAKAMDEGFKQSQYGDTKHYDGEHGFYVMQDSSGHVWPEPYDIEKSTIDRSGIGTQIAPYFPSWRWAGDFLLNHKPVAIYHPHPNGGRGWIQGTNAYDLTASQHTGLPNIIKAPDGLHYSGVPTPAKPAPYHGLFDWFK